MCLSVLAKEPDVSLRNVRVQPCRPRDCTRTSGLPQLVPVVLGFWRGYTFQRNSNRNVLSTLFLDIALKRSML